MATMIETCARALVAALDAKEDSVAISVHMRNLRDAVRGEDKASHRANWVSAAQENYAGDDIEIDSDASVSENDNGAWVSAWVHVRDEDAEIE